MPRADENALRAQIKEGRFARIYVIYGNDAHLKRLYADRIAEKFLGKESYPDGLRELDGKGLTPDVYYDAAATVSFFGGRKCVRVRDFDWESLSETRRNDMRSALAETPEDCTAIFWYQSADPAASKGKKDSFLAAAEACGAVLAELNHPDPARLPKILCDYAVKRGSRMHPSTAKKLIALAGNDLQTLFNEIDKLSAYAGETEIEPRHLDLLCAKTAETAVYALAKALTAGRMEEAYEVLRDLRDARTEPPVILGTLSRAYADMYRVKAGTASGKRLGEIAAAYGLRESDWRLKSAAARASGVDLSALRRCLEILVRADGRIKGSKADPGIVIEQTMLELALAAKGKA